MVLEILLSISKGGVTHQVLTVLLLGTLHHHTFFRSWLEYVRVAVLNLRVSVKIPVNLELGHSRLLGQNVSGKAGNVSLRRRVIIHLLVVILYINVVTYAHEFLVVVEGASQKNGSDSDNVTLRHARDINLVSLKQKISLILFTYF